MKHARAIEFDYANFLAMLISFCLTFLLLAWIMPIPDALQVDIFQVTIFWIVYYCYLIQNYEAYNYRRLLALFTFLMYIKLYNC